jgi:hypothetical protein
MAFWISSSRSRNERKNNQALRRYVGNRPRNWFIWVMADTSDRHAVSPVPPGWQRETGEDLFGEAQFSQAVPRPRNRPKNFRGSFSSPRIPSPLGAQKKPTTLPAPWALQCRIVADDGHAGASVSPSLNPCGASRVRWALLPLKREQTRPTMSVPWALPLPYAGTFSVSRVLRSHVTPNACSAALNALDPSLRCRVSMAKRISSGSACLATML